MLRNFNELIRLAMRLENVLRNVGVAVRIGKPNLIGLLIPDSIVFTDEQSMLRFARLSIEQASVTLFSDLEMVFIYSSGKTHNIVITPGVSPETN